MAHRHTSSSGIINFTDRVDTKVLESPNKADNGGLSQALELHRVEIANRTGADAVVGWGYAYGSAALKIGDYDTVGPSPKYTDQTDALAGGATLLGTGGGIIIQAPERFNAATFNVTVVGGAVSDVKYWNGSAFVTNGTSAAESLDPTALSVSTEVRYSSPVDEVALAAGDSPVDDDGLTAGMYAWLIELASPVTIDRLEVIRLQNLIAVVANGNSLVDVYDGGKKLPTGVAVVPYISAANTDNFFIAEFSKA
jgi:hypothetical protein